MMMMLVNQEVRKSKKGKTCQLFSLWKLTHYLFLFYEGNEDEIEDMDEKNWTRMKYNLQEVREG